MEWFQVFMIIASFAGFMTWIRNDLHSSSERLDAHVRDTNKRLDEMYRMFVDLIKNGNGK